MNVHFRAEMLAIDRDAAQVGLAELAEHLRDQDHEDDEHVHDVPAGAEPQEEVATFQADAEDHVDCEEAREDEIHLASRHVNMLKILCTLTC